MPTINGAAVSWAMPGFTLTPTTQVGTLIAQGIEHTKNDEPETIKNASGQTATRIWPDPSQDLMFEYFVSGSSLADASNTQCLIPDPGYIVTLAFGTYPALGSSPARCEVQSGTKLSLTNTSARKVSLPLKIWPLVTAAATP